MSRPPVRRSQRASSVLATSVVVALVVAGGSWLVLRSGGGSSVDRSEPSTGAPGSDAGSDADAPTPSASSPTDEVTAAEPARRARSVLRAEAPTSTRLPSGTTLPVRAVGTRPDGLLDVPDDIRTAGWWRGGSRIGDPFGSTLIAAHVDSTTQGLGPYSQLLEVSPGDRVRVRTASLVQDFVITRLTLIPQGPLDGQDWLFGAGGTRRLTLVTCAPPYDASRGGYQQLAVVTAEPDGAPRRQAVS